jgi:hypothetical protein
MPMQMRTPIDVPVTLPATQPRLPTPEGGLWIIGCCLGALLIFMAGVVALPDGSFAKMGSAVREGLGSRQERAPDVKVERAPAAAAPAPTPAATATSLPNSAIEADMTLVIFPPRAKRRRVWFDGVPLKRNGAQSMKLQCGLHTIKIGAMGKTSPVQLPCGGETTLL